MQLRISRVNRPVILIGLSGVGKSTLIRALAEEPPFTIAVRYTTRPPRPDDVNSRVVHVAQLQPEPGLFLYSGWGADYAVDLRFVQECLNSGSIPLIELGDWPTAQLCACSLDSPVRVLIMRAGSPTDFEGILLERGMSPASIRERLAEFEADLAELTTFSAECDIVIQNEGTVAQVAQRLKCSLDDLMNEAFPGRRMT
jgi:guanylate kinase